MSKNLKVSLQYLLPKTTISTIAGKFANKSNFATQLAIKKFIKAYQINMQEAIHSDPSNYNSFNDFFTRQLKPGIRPIDNSDLVAPVDGSISQLGNITQQQIIQAKGHNYSSLDLLAGQQQLADKFIDGNFATIYLSPQDYHRIHMPCAGQLKQMLYVPGQLFSVNQATVAQVPNLFARNERVICIFSSQFGDFALILVGATIVGSMATSWHGVVNPPRLKKVKQWDYQEQQIKLDKGQEMGKFLLGSTVILLFAKNQIKFNPQWQAGQKVTLGSAMAQKVN